MTFDNNKDNNKNVSCNKDNNINDKNDTNDHITIILIILIMKKILALIIIRKVSSSKYPTSIPVG